jgi:HlyD family secretion protein
MKKKIIIAAVVIFFIIIILLNIKGKNGIVKKVKVQQVIKTDIVEKVNATGEVKPKKFVDLSSDISGRIVRIAVKEGDFVKKGQFLLKIDSTYNEWEVQRAKASLKDLQVQVKIQKANLEARKREYSRYKSLWKDKMISDEMYENKKLAYENALNTYQSYLHRIDESKASLKSAEEKIKKSIINSPIDGVVSSLKVEEGEVAIIGTMNNPGTVLMTIADLSVMEVEVEVDETDIINVSVGQEAEVSVDAFPDIKIKGKVSEVGSSALQKTGLQQSSDEAKTFKTVITLINPPKKIKPGLSASADIIVAKAKDVLTIPISAIVVREIKDKKGEGGKNNDEKKNNEKEGVFVYKNGIAKFTEIEKGITGDMDIEVKKGLSLKDKIIIGPFKILRLLNDGDKVKIIKTDKKKKFDFK